MANDLIKGVSEVMPTNAEDGFIATVLSMPDGDKKVELLDKLLTMRETERARMAKMLFDTHFAELRADLLPVVKAKENSFLKSKYAPLADLQTACDPVIFKHGFSYSWREEALKEGKRVHLDISGYGHTKSNYFDSPQIPGTNATNAIQAAGIMSSYGQRYTFKAGFGIVTIDEDTDGEYRSVKIDDDLQYYINSLMEAKDTESLMAIYQEGFNKYKADSDKKRIIIGAYTEAKQKIIKGE